MSQVTFFLSYARRDNDGEWVTKFYEDLVREVAAVKGLSQGIPLEQIGFMDTETIELGDDWEDQVEFGLRRCSVLVCLYSPAFFNSLYCGKELQVFLDRLEGLDPRPPAILPVLWQHPDRLPDPLPKVLENRQYTHADLGKSYAELGLRYIAKLNKYQDDYTDFLRIFARQIAEIEGEHELQPMAAPLPRLKDVKSAFESLRSVSDDNGLEQRATGPRFANFVFVAARREEITNGAQSEHVYGDDPRRQDWCPFAPTEPEPVALAAQSAAAAERLIYEALPLDEDLLERVRIAEQKNTIVVLVVDPWTIKRVQRYRTLLEKYDQRAFVNCAVHVVWNDAHELTRKARAALAAEVNRVFSRNITLRFGPFTDSIESYSQLEQELTASLNLVRSRIFERARVYLPPGGSEALPSVSGPGETSL